MTLNEFINIQKDHISNQECNVGYLRDYNNYANKNSLIVVLKKITEKEVFKQ